MSQATRRTIADITALVAVALVLALGAVVVVKPAVDHWSDVYRQDPFATRTTTETVVKEMPAKPPETTTTTKERDGSFAERSLGNSGYLLFRVAIVLVAAFLAGAAVQRAVLGEFGVEVGPVKVPQLAKAAEASRSGLASLRARLTRVQRDTVARDAATHEQLAKAVEETERLRQQVEEIERRLGGGGGPGRA